MTLKNNRAHLLYNIKLCASFHSHQWIKTGVISGNIQFGSKSASFFPVWPWNLTHWSLTVLAEQRPKAICQPAARTVKSYAVLISPWMLASNGTFVHSYCHQNRIFFPNIYQISWYLSGFFFKYECKWHQITSKHKLWSTKYWPIFAMTSELHRRLMPALLDVYVHISA